MNSRKKNRSSRLAALLGLAALIAPGHRALAQDADFEQAKETLQVATELEPLTAEQAERLAEELARVELQLEVQALVSIVRGHM